MYQFKNTRNSILTLFLILYTYDTIRYYVQYIILLSTVFPTGVHAEKRFGHHVPQKSLPRLSYRAQVQRVGQCQAQARYQRVPHGQADRLSSALGANIHRHAQRPIVRRETELGGENGQNDTGTNR